MQRSHFTAVSVAAASGPSARTAGAMVALEVGQVFQLHCSANSALISSQAHRDLGAQSNLCWYVQNPHWLFP